MRRDCGQVGLILIMIMAAVGAVSLSLASRAITGLKTAETDIDSLKAFKAAEAGLERALSSRDNISGSIDESLGYNASFEFDGTSNGGYVTEAAIDPGVALGIVTEATSGLLRILWSDQARAAVKVSVYDDNGGVYDTYYYAYDGIDRGNNFDAPAGSQTFEEVNFSDYADIPVREETVLVRVLPLYESTRIGVAPQETLTLPPQQFRVVATGTDSNSNVSRRIELTKSGEVLPSVFDHVLFTTGSISQ